MRHCDSCGGVLGRDCFNPIECAQITRSMEQDTSQDLARANSKYNTLLSTVKAMREAQKSYFSTRTSEALTDSKRLEKQVDKLIEEEYQDPQLRLL